MKRGKKIYTVGLLLTLTVLLSGCSINDMFNWIKDFEQDFKGLEMVVETYDTNSKKIDHLEGKSVKIEKDTTFDRLNGESVKESKVIQMTIGGNDVHHVGSSMIAYEKGMENVFDKYDKTVDIDSQKRSVPIINSMFNDFQNDFLGKKKTILIRSQSGFPLATFTGDKVTMTDTDVPSSTNFLVDGKRLFVYRCDYTVYDNQLLEKQ